MSPFAILSPVKYHPDSLLGLELDNDDYEFLTKVGLSNLDSDDLIFFPEIAKNSSKSGYHQIGKYGILNDLPLYVRTEIGGVWILDDRLPDPILMNSSVKSLSRFISIRQKYLLDMGKFIPSKMKVPFVGVIANCLEEIDAAAMQPGQIWHQCMSDLVRFSEVLD